MELDVAPWKWSVMLQFFPLAALLVDNALRLDTTR